MKGSSQSAFSLAHCIFASSSSSVSPSSIAWFSNALIYSLKILVFRKRSAEYNRSLKSSSSFLFSSSNSSLFRSSSLRRFSLSSASIRSVFLLSASISRYARRYRNQYHEGNFSFTQAFSFCFLMYLFASFRRLMNGLFFSRSAS